MTVPTITLSAQATTTGTRTFEGIAAPYGEVTRDGRRVAFAPGAFGDVSDMGKCAVYVQHPFNAGVKAVRVGYVEEWTDTPAGLAFSARLNESEAADGIYAALQDGSITEVSVGVYVSTFEESDDVTTYTSSEVLELSLIADGQSAFAGSTISAVFAAASNDSQESSTNNQESTTMEDTNTQLVEFAERLDNLDVSIARLADAATPTADTESKFQSFGEVVKGLHENDADALKEITEFAYSGPTSANTNKAKSWAQPVIKIIDNGRPVTNLFTRYPDPGTNIIEYLKKDFDTIQVAEQVNEGDDLAYGKIGLTSATLTMKTYGGWFDFSQQALERADVNVIEMGYQALAAKYAEVTEAKVKTTLLGATGTSVTGFDATNYGKVIDTTVDAVTALNDKGHQAEFILCSPDNFKKLAKLNTGSSNDLVLSRDNGSLDVPGLKASIFGIPVYVVAGTSNLFTFTNSRALGVWESNVGRLNDSNIVNLTSAFSLYGYLGTAVVDETAIVKAVA